MKRLVTTLCGLLWLAPGCEPAPHPKVGLEPIERTRAPDRTSPPERTTPPDGTTPVTPDPTTPAPGGTDDVVLSSDGRYLMALTSSDRCLAIADVEERTAVSVPSLCGLRAIRAGAPGHAVVLSSDGRSVSDVDLATSKATLRYLADEAYRTVIVAPDGAHAALANLPDDPASIAAVEADVYALPLRHVVLIDLAAATGERFTTAYAARDVDFTDTRMVVTESFWNKMGFPRAVLQLFERDTATWATDIEFPNCADDLRLQPGGTLAILSPRTCSLHDVILASQQPPPPDTLPKKPDPISVVDLASGAHLGNVPGFGPVSWSPDGKTAVGFTERESLMIEWNSFQEKPFGLIVVELDDLTWRVTDIGDTQPTFFFAPDSERVLVRSTEDGAAFDGSLDPATGALTDLHGPAVSLDVRAAAAGRVYVSDAGVLHRLDAAAVTVVPIAGEGDVLHARPQGDLLLVTSRTEGIVYLVGLEDEAVQGLIALPGPLAF